MSPMPNFQGQTSLEPPAEPKKYCPRCARPAVRVSDNKYEIWNCTNGHGEVFRKVLPVPETVAAEGQAKGWTPDPPKSKAPEKKTEDWTPAPPKQNV